MTLTSGKIKPANDRQLFLLKKLEMASRRTQIIDTLTILIHSNKWAGFPVLYWLRNVSVLLP